MKARAVAIAATVLGVALLIGAVVMAVIGIWTVGPDAERWGGTSALLGFIGVFVLMGAFIAWDA